jgi:hypothetical protein
MKTKQERSYCIVYAKNIRFIVIKSKKTDDITIKNFVPYLNICQNPHLAEESIGLNGE